MRSLPISSFLLIAGLAVPALAAPPALSFDAKAVTAAGITPKGRVIWFSIAREISRQSATIVPRIELATDDDGASDEDGQADGTLRASLARLEGIGPSPLPPPAHVSPRDLLLVIDPNSMEFLRFQVRN
jgi:hypothetical protein